MSHHGYRNNKYASMKCKLDIFSKTKVEKIATFVLTNVLHYNSIPEIFKTYPIWSYLSFYLFSYMYDMFINCERLNFMYFS
jgi:hypothetical protein